MDLGAVKNDPGLALWLDGIMDVNKTKDQIAEIVIGLRAVLCAHGVESVDQHGKIIKIKLDLHSSV